MPVRRGPGGMRGAPTRRQLLRGGALSAGAVLGGALLAGCARHGAGTPVGPAGQQPVVSLTFMPWWIDWDQTGRALLADQCARFEAAHPGLRLAALPGPNGGGADATAVLTSILSGTGPDVVCDYQTHWPEYMQAQAFANLDRYLQRDAIDTTIWSAAHLAALRTADGQFALPTFDGPVVYAYRLDILQALGLPPPDPDWTFTDAAQLWRRCAATVPGAGTGLPRYGAAVPWWQERWGHSNWLLVGFGGAQMDAAGTRALFSAPESIAAGQWLMPLIWEQVVGFFGSPGLETGRTVFSPRGGWMVSRDVVTYGDRFPWDYAPAPVFPQGRATYGNSDYWGLNALSPHPDAAWEVVKWLAYEDGWQRFCMKTALLQPCRNDLWQQWEQVMVQTAPVLRGKALKWYRDAAQGGYGYAPEFFRYEAVQADRIISDQLVRLNRRQTDVASAFTAATAQVNALERAGAARDAAVARAVASVQGIAGSGTSVPLAPPQITGAGRAAQGAPGPPRARSGVYTVRGGGSDVGGQSDNCALLCRASNESVQTFTCRVTLLANVDCPSLAPWAKAGLMARGDLSDDAPMAFVAVTADRGIQTGYRLAAGDDPGGQTASTARSGVIAARYIAVGAAGRANALLRPVWLRLLRRGAAWSAQTSLDGRAWAAAGPPTAVLAAGVWIGVFVSAVNGAFPRGARGQIEATFDELTFAPQAAYRVGTD